MKRIARWLRDVGDYRDADNWRTRSRFTCGKYRQTWLYDRKAIGVGRVWLVLRWPYMWRWGQP